MTDSMTERGAALIATLILMMILLPLGAYVVLQCRTDWLLERNFRAELEAFYAAEAGLEHAVAEIEPGQSFDDVLAGPDRIAGTSDDGVFPFREGTPVDFASASLRYDVRLALTSGNMLSIVSYGSGRHGATKVVAALAARSALPFTPAALYAAGDIRGIDLGSGQLLLSGLDHLLSDAPASANGSAPAVAALASPDAAAEEALRLQLAGGLAGQFVGAGGTPSLATTGDLRVQNHATRLAAQPTSVRLGTLNVSDTAVLGTPRTPQISVVAGDADIAGWLSGTGILIVGGSLHVTGTFEFSGLVIALNSLLLESSGSMLITGALWQGPAADAALELRGSGAIMYSSRALGAVDAAFPGLLPHAVVLTGWQEQL